MKSNTAQIIKAESMEHPQHKVVTQVPTVRSWILFMERSFSLYLNVSALLRLTFFWLRAHFTRQSYSVLKRANRECIVTLSNAFGRDPRWEGSSVITVLNSKQCRGMRGSWAAVSAELSCTSAAWEALLTEQVSYQQIKAPSQPCT